ncbi:MAG: EamA family transporter [Deltaproteobacteria bacterium]|nr:EamA family transporter [Deltaproteobacteria bacterium]
MLWFPLSLVAALTAAINDVITKRFFGDLTPYEMGLVRLLYALPYLIAGLFLVPWPTLDGTFWTCLAVGLPLELIAFLCYMKAIKVSPLSLTIPFLAFTPAFVILTGYLFLGEILTSYGILGILLIVAGSYVLNLSGARRAWAAPFKAVFREPGSALMLATSFIYSITATLGKLAIVHSSQQFFAVTYFLIFFCFVFSLLPFMGKGKLRNIIERPIPGIFAGLVFAAMIYSHTLAISLVEAAYMLSVKRTSLLFAVIFGGLFFREQYIGERLLGSAVMMGGVLVIGFLA